MKAPLRIDGVFDIETSDWDRFIVGALLLDDGAQGTLAIEPDERAFFELLLSVGPGTHIYAHNGGRFDTLWFLGRALKRKGLTVEPILAGSRVISLKVKGRAAGEGITIRDSAALAPLSLAQFSELAGAGREKITLGPRFPCACGEDCGGYCALAPWVSLSAPQRADLASYLERDCRALLGALRAWRSYADEHGFVLRATLGSSAWATARAELGLPDARWSPALYHRIRAGYFGGRVEVFRPTAPAIRLYDINSAYPAALEQTDLPVGPARVVDRVYASRAYHSGAAGLYSAEVSVPDDARFPPLPVRVGDRIAYPVGPVSGEWTGLELRHAEETGARIVRLGSAVVWPLAERVLAPFVRRIWELRRVEIERAGKKSGLATLLKLLVNSLTGKFAQSPHVEDVRIDPPSGEIKACSRRGRCRERCSGVCGAWHQIDRAGRVWRVPRYSLGACAHVEWAAHLTAACRVELHRQLEHAGSSAVYCDTDSVFATAVITRRIGHDLGEWSDDGERYEWSCEGPKGYCYRTDAGKWTYKAKGISDLDGDRWSAYREHTPVASKRGVKTFKTAVRQMHLGGELFARRSLVRRSHADGTWFGSRRLDATGATRPVSLVEVLDRA